MAEPTFHFLRDFHTSEDLWSSHKTWQAKALEIYAQKLGVYGEVKPGVNIDEADFDRIDFKNYTELRQRMEAYNSIFEPGSFDRADARNAVIIEVDFENRIGLQKKRGAEPMDIADIFLESLRLSKDIEFMITTEPTSPLYVEQPQVISPALFESTTGFVGSGLNYNVFTDAFENWAPSNEPELINGGMHSLVSRWSLRGNSSMVHPVTRQMRE